MRNTSTNLVQIYVHNQGISFCGLLLSASVEKQVIYLRANKGKKTMPGSLALFNEED
jgi:hypothetical protein